MVILSNTFPIAACGGLIRARDKAGIWTYENIVKLGGWYRVLS